VVIGGNEDRLQDRVILRRFVAMCGGPDARITLITAASEDPQGAWRGYEPVFREIGAHQVSLLPMFDRASASDPSIVSRILASDGLFISGGDQNRLMDILWESEAARAMHIAFHLQGCCIGGTSAGAAVMSRHMLAQGMAVYRPQKDVVSTDIGLGFVSKAIIDQHFSERRRLGRLLSAIAQRPDLIGVGIDEDTALVIERGQAVEVIGQGTVTLVDARRMQSNLDDIESEEGLELIGVQLHLLPAGHRYAVPGARRGARRLPAPLAEAVAMLVEPGPLRG
jgi:cyanophycinase